MHSPQVASELPPGCKAPGATPVRRQETDCGPDRRRVRGGGEARRAAAHVSHHWCSFGRRHSPGAFLRVGDP
eukprot:15539151-Heterocapsa_arctica.AAC.1